MCVIVRYLLGVVLVSWDGLGNVVICCWVWVLVSIVGIGLEYRIVVDLVLVVWYVLVGCFRSWFGLYVGVIDC